MVADFLLGRTFQVSVGDSKSKCHNVTSGIPQGSVLGPLLFLLYINYLPDEISSHVSLFADDLKMYTRTSSNVNIQADLYRLEQWQNTWLLKFNTIDNKCKVLHIGPDNPCNEYYLDGNVLPSVDSERDLGVTISSNLKWDVHINNCIKKANSCVAWVTRIVIYYPSCTSYDNHI